MRALLLISLLAVAVSAQDDVVVDEFFDVSLAAVGCDCAFEVVPRDTTVCCGEDPDVSQLATASAGGVALDVEDSLADPVDGVIIRTFTADCPAAVATFFQDFEIDGDVAFIQQFFVNTGEEQGFALVSDPLCPLMGPHSDPNFVRWGVFDDDDCDLYSIGAGHSDLFTLPPVNTDSCTALTVSFNYSLQIDALSTVVAVISVSGADANTEFETFQFVSGAGGDPQLINDDPSPLDATWKPFVFERTAGVLGFDDGIAAVHLEFFASANPEFDQCGAFLFEEFLPCDEGSPFIGENSMKVQQNPLNVNKLDFIIEASEPVNEVFLEFAQFADAALIANDIFSVGDFHVVDCQITSGDDRITLGIAPAIPSLFNSDECASGNSDINDLGDGPSSSFDLQVFILWEGLESFTLTCDFGVPVCPSQVQGVALYDFGIPSTVLAAAALPASLTVENVQSVLPSLVVNDWVQSIGATDPHPENANPCEAELAGVGFLVDDINITCTGEPRTISATQQFDIIPGAPIEQITFNCPSCANELFDTLHVDTNVECPVNPTSPTGVPDTPIGPVCMDDEFIEVDHFADPECSGLEPELVLRQQVTILADKTAPDFVDIDSICLKASNLWARFDVGLEFFAVQDNCDRPEDISIDVVGCDIVDSVPVGSAADASGGSGVDAASRHGGSESPCKIVTNADGSQTIFLQGVKPRQGTRVFEVDFLLTDLCDNPNTVTRYFFIDSNPKSLECFAGSWQQNTDGTFSLADGSGVPTAIGSPVPAGNAGGRRDNSNNNGGATPTTTRRNTDTDTNASGSGRRAATTGGSSGSSGSGGSSSGGSSGRGKNKAGTATTTRTGNSGGSSGGTAKTKTKTATKANKTKTKAAKTKNAGTNTAKAKGGKAKANKTKGRR